VIVVPPTLQPDGFKATRSTDEQFLDLLLADEDLLRAEFDAIVAAEWPGPPPGRPGRGARAEGRPGETRRRCARAAGSPGWDAPSGSAAGRGNAHLRNAHFRPRQVEPTTGKVGDSLYC
jgi:hypothetical protein